MCRSAMVSLVDVSSLMLPDSESRDRNYEIVVGSDSESTRLD